MKQVRKLIAANGQESIPAVGTYIFLKSAAGELLVKTDEDESAFMTAGDFIRTDRKFTQLDIQDLSGSQNQFTIVIADEGEAGKYGNVNIVAPSVLVSAVDVVTVAATATLVIAANGSRSEAFVTPAVAGRVGDSAITATRGTPVGAGSTLILTTQAAVYFFAAGASTCAVLESEF